MKKILTGIETFLIYACFPIAFIYFIRNFIRYIRQRMLIFGTLKSSQSLVNSLDDLGFYFHKFEIFGKELFTTGILENTQLVEDKSQFASNMHSSSIKRIILQNIKETIGEGVGYPIGQNTRLEILQPNSTVLYVSLIPTWLNPMLSSLRELVISLGISGLLYGLYTLVLNYTTWITF